MNKLHLLILILFFALNISENLKSQSLTVFDIDTTSFPVMKAHFYAYDSTWHLIGNILPTDFTVTENGINRQVLNVSCPPQDTAEALSSILVMDVSASMGWAPKFNINLAKEAGKAWVNGLPLGKSECGITAFSSIGYLIQDYTTSKNKLIAAIDGLTPIANTNYDAAFWDSPVSGIPICQPGKYKKVIVFLSDGLPNFEPQTQHIIDLANQNNITIYAVTLNMSCPQCLKDISTQTNGQWFENVTTVEEARAVYLKILQMAQKSTNPCEIDWQSDLSCTQLRNVNFYLSLNNLSDNGSYLAPQVSVVTLDVNPQTINYGGITPMTFKDTSVTITAINGDITIDSIIPKEKHFTVQNYGGSSPPFTITKGNSRTLTIRFTASDSAYYNTSLNIYSNACRNNFVNLTGGFQGYKQGNSLRLIFPNGGEEFLVGVDTVITWTGVLPTDTVKLEYSTDAGTTWIPITDKATGLVYHWNGVPNTPSRRCLARVSMALDTGLNCYCAVGSPIASYKFNDNLSDASGNNYDIVPGSGYQFIQDRFGNPNSALMSTTTTMTISSGCPGIFGSQARTVSYWVKKSGKNATLCVGWGGISGVQGSAIGCNAFSYYSGKGVSFDVQLGVTAFDAIIDDGKWHHLVFIVPCKNDPRLIDCQIYFDGSLLTSINYNFINLQNSQNCKINTIKNTTLPGIYINMDTGCCLDELRIYDCALGISDIQYLYNLK